MTHLSEDARRLAINLVEIHDDFSLLKQVEGFEDVCLLILPAHNQFDRSKALMGLEALVQQVADQLGPNTTLITIGEMIDLVHVHASLESLTYQLWVAIKRNNPKYCQDNSRLPENHFGALVHTKYDGSLKHALTRIEYTYCPACNKTTKDYGGKKHTYNPYGTLISDIWRDIACDLEGDISAVIERFADLFGVEPYEEMLVFDCRSLWKGLASEIIKDKPPIYAVQPTLTKSTQSSNGEESQLLLGDCLHHLKKIPENSIDFAFIDPPYNLGKNYNNYSDDLSIKEYFEWCDEWIAELARILRPGRTVAILNIPLWAIRHFLFMETLLDFQNWIAWDALSFPVRKIMPAHYAIVCFSKGKPRGLPGLAGEIEPNNMSSRSKTFLSLKPLAEWYCLRASCVRKRNAMGFTDRGELTDLWWDIHRLKHNSRRVDHPCQLPPQLIYRLISTFTIPGEVVVDCFNGAGTTSLAAHQLGRRYVGIELSEKYYDIAQSRHKEIKDGYDPFRKVKRKLTEKNSPVARMSKRHYDVPKKTLQLEVRRVSKNLDKLPTREDMIKYGKYPIKYYDEYFSSWGEVCAAARHEGMVETKEAHSKNHPNHQNAVQLDLFNRGSSDAKR